MSRNINTQVPGTFIYLYVFTFMAPLRSYSRL